MAASSTGSGAGRTSGGSGAVSSANAGRPPPDRIVTGTGPAPSSKTIGVISASSSIAPIAARARAVPTVG